LNIIVKDRDSAPWVGTLTAVVTAAVSNGQVAFFGQYIDPTGSESHSGVFLGSGGPLTTIVKTGDPSPSGTFERLGFPTISGDTIAFKGADSAGPGIFTVDLAGNSVAVARTGTATPWGKLNNFSDPEIGGSTVAFAASLDGSLKYGLFTNPGGAPHSIIQTGDMLFGSTVAELASGSLQSPGFGIDASGSGNVAFTYRLANGRTGIAIASPVPESDNIVSAIILMATFGTAAIPIGKRKKLMNRSLSVSWLAAFAFIFFLPVKSYGNPSNAAGLFHVVAITGQQAPGVTAGSVFSGFTAPVINNLGQTAFVATVPDINTPGSHSVGIWSEGTGNLAAR
jgi:hypothetical protein